MAKKYSRTPRECVDWNVPHGLGRWKQRPVALPVSAWIEIMLDEVDSDSIFVALPVSAWIEINADVMEKLGILEVALPVSAWIEISIILIFITFVFSRTPRECVDWNKDLSFINSIAIYVALPVSAWIEMRDYTTKAKMLLGVALPVSAWIEI